MTPHSAGTIIVDPVVEGTSEGGDLEFGLLLPRPLREGAGGWGKSLQALLPDNLQDSLNIFNYIGVPK